MEKKYSRVLTIGDIHGHYDALIQVLMRCDFKPKEDLLISLGDIVDRGPNSKDCVTYLMTLPNFISIRGNHDMEWYRAICTGRNMLYDEGGRETLLSYTRGGCGNDPTKIPDSHKEFFKNQVNYYIDKDKNLFIHGGFDRHLPIKGQMERIYYWDRDLFLAALSHSHMRDNDKHPFKTKDKFKEIFIGHTPTTYWDVETPMHAANIWNVDTGVAKGGKLTIMDVETKEFWQSDTTKNFYDETSRETSS